MYNFFLVSILLFLFIRIIFKKNNKKRIFYIVLTGSIGAGKSTLAKYLKEFLEKKGFKVHVCEELAIKYRDALAHYYSNIENGSIETKAFWFQSFLLSKYYMLYKYEIKEFEQKYDIIILDRTEKDTKFFTMANVTNQDDLDFLNKQCDEIKTYYNLVLYLNPGFENIIKYKEERAREVEEKVDRDYLKKIYDIYEENIDKIYPDHIHFDSGVSLDEYNSLLEMYYKSGIFS